MHLATSESVVAEIIDVLTSPSIYRRSRTTVAHTLRPVIAIPGLRLDHKGSVLAAIDRWEATTLDVADRPSVEHVRRDRLDGISSYDRDFDRIDGRQRLEP